VGSDSFRASHIVIEFTHTYKPSKRHSFEIYKVCLVVYFSKHYWLVNKLTSGALGSAFQQNGFWIGLHDRTVEGRFYWTAQPGQQGKSSFNKHHILEF